MAAGDRVLEQATAHFKKQIQDNTESVEVPEWGTTVYYRPMNGRQRDAILKYVNEGHIFEALVESIIVRARDEEGALMFKAGHKLDLMNRVDPKVIERLADQMRTLDSALLEEEDEEVPIKKS